MTTSDPVAGEADRTRPLVVAVLQARLSSRRLPGKVLLPILARPMLELQIERVRRAGSLDQLIVATSDQPDDDPIESLCRRIGVECRRGSLDDVLARVYRAVEPLRPDYVVRLTADCPLSDPEVIDGTVRYCVEGGHDYASNAIEPTFPDGLDVGVMKFSALETAHLEAGTPAEREHVTLFLRSRPERFSIGSYRDRIDRSAMRWTVDEQKDLDFVRAVYERLYPVNPAFSTQDILRLLDVEPALHTINRGIERDEGLRRSLEGSS